MRAECISSAWAEQKIVREIMVFLHIGDTFRVWKAHWLVNRIEAAYDLIRKLVSCRRAR
jgi:hypothetical protein